MSGNTYPDPPLLCETGTPILPNNPLYLVIFPNPTTIPRLALWNDGSHEPKEKLELRRLEDVEGQRVTHRLDSASRIVLKIIHPGHPTFGNIEDRNLHSDHAPGFDDPGCGHWSGLAVVQVSTGSVKLVSVDYDGHNDEAVRKNRFMQRRKNDEGADQVIFGPELTQTTTDDQWLLEDFDIAIANRG